MNEHLFANQLILWYKINKRNLPWRNTKDAYPIWLSEIILQQTRVNQGLSYYEKFLGNFPTVFDLANASEEAFDHPRIRASIYDQHGIWLPCGPL